MNLFQICHLKIVVFVCLRLQMWKVVTDPHEVLEAVQSAWQHLFNNNKQLSWESFLAETCACIPKTECDLPHLTGQFCARKLSSQRLPEL